MAKRSLASEGQWYVASCDQELARRLQRGSWAVPLFSLVFLSCLLVFDAVSPLRGVVLLGVVVLSLQQGRLARRVKGVVKNNVFAVQRAEGLGLHARVLLTISLSMAGLCTALHIDVVADYGPGAIESWFSLAHLLGLAVVANHSLAVSRRAAILHHAILLVPVIGAAVLVGVLEREPVFFAQALVVAAFLVACWRLVDEGWKTWISAVTWNRALMLSQQDLQKSHTDLLRETQRVAQAQRQGTLASLAGGLAHEINNPLTIVSGHLNGLVRWASSDVLSVDSGRIRHRLDRMQRAVDRMRNVVSSLMVLSRPASSEPPKTMDLRELVPVWAQTLVHGQVGLELEVVAPDNPIGVLAQKDHVSQVLRALMINAIEATDGAAKRLVRITIAETSREGRVWIEDSGPGVPLAIVDRIFEPFFSTKTEVKSVGLGLAISKALLQAEGGDLEHLPGRALTTFLVRLPKGHAEPLRALLPDESPEANPELLRRAS
jgi:signal transduction histidine kinase